MKKKTIISSSIVLLILIIVGIVIFNNYKGKNLVLNSKGEYDISKKYQTITIKADGVVLKNADANKIVIHENVADGTIRLTDIKTKELAINGGGINSVYVDGKSEIGKTNVNRKDKNVHVNIAKQVKLKELNVLGGKKVILSGTLNKVNLKANNIKLELNDAVVNELSLQKNNNTVTVDKNTTVSVEDTIIIEDKIDSSDIENTTDVVNDPLEEIIVVENETSSSDIENTTDVEKENKTDEPVLENITE